MTQLDRQFVRRIGSLQRRAAPGSVLVLDALPQSEPRTSVMSVAYRPSGAGQFLLRKVKIESRRLETFEELIHALQCDCSVDRSFST